jgi:hypothetical protein
MKRLIDILAALNKMSAIMHEASKHDNFLQPGGKTVVTVNPDWLKEASKSLDDMAETLGEIVAERCKDE